jgi:hypothetical protein
MIINPRSRPPGAREDACMAQLPLPLGMSSNETSLCRLVGRRISNRC